MRFVVLVAVAMLTGCSVSNRPPATDQFVAEADTMEIIRSAAEAAPKGVRGEYELTIKAAGKQGAMLYLNTELDYRDQRNVTVALYPQLVPQLTAQSGQTPERFFIGKTVRVKGMAQRVRIDFINAEREPSGKYYFQTHIYIKDLSQIELVQKSS